MIASEQAILGAMLLDPMLAERGVERLTEEDFTVLVHRRLFRAISEAIQLGRPVERETLNTLLGPPPILPEILTDIVESATTVGGFDAHAVLVRDAAHRRALVHLGQQLAHRAGQPEPPTRALIADAETALLRLHDPRAHLPRRFQQLVVPTLDGIEAQLLQSSAAGVSTGFAALDDLTGGWHRQDLVLIAGRPSMGKTALALQCAVEAAAGGHPTLLLSLEMAETAVVQRILAARAGVPAFRLRTGALTGEDIAACCRAGQGVATWPLWIDDTPRLTVSAARAVIRRMASTVPIRCVVIDYLQLMHDPAARREGRVAEVTAISQGLKALARELDVTILALSQLSRASEQRTDREPMLSDLRDSGALEQDADLVLFIHRPEYYNREDPTLIGKAKLIVAKHRNGPIGVIPLRFDHQVIQFSHPTTFAPTLPEGS